MSGRARANGEGSIFPYRNGFAAYVWVTTPAGTRRRKYVYGQSREVVHEKWIALQKRAQEGPVVTSTPTVAQFLAYWLEEIIEPNRAPLTYATYESMCRLYLIPGLGSTRLDRLRVRDVQTWLNRTRRTCQCCAQGKDAARPESKRRCCTVGECCGQVPSARTVRDMRTVLRSALTQAGIEDLVAKNVASLVTLPAGRARKSQAWSSEEARRFLESARDDGDWLYAAYVLVLVLGLRKGEVLGLSWSDIDLDDGTLSVSHQLQRVRRKLLYRETKTETSEADLPLPGICVAALEARQEAAAKEQQADGYVVDELDLVFTHRLGEPVEPSTFGRKFAARCRAAGVRRITVHDARRTCASLLVDLDVHPRVIMQILRHAQFAVTMEVYAKASSKATRDALKRLGESLDGSAE